MKLYRTGYGRELIEEVEVEKHNEKSVWMKNTYNGEINRRAKHSNYDDFWSTIGEAKQCLEGKFNRQISRLKKDLSTAEGLLKDLKKY